MNEPKFKVTLSGRGSMLVGIKNPDKPLAMKEFCLLLQSFGVDANNKEFIASLANNGGKIEAGAIIIEWKPTQENDE